MDWKACVDSGMAKRITPDKEMVAALLITADKRMKSVDMLKTNSVTANSKVSLAYDALREVLEALAIKYGYKIYNHECYTCFLKEVLRQNQIAEEFDIFRKARNRINYYGNELSIEEADILIRKIKDLNNIIVKLL
ncbi:hypothetical protein M1112_00410 [Candidatus Parvarchaeota archaeon]|jgi:hypothetical protein|nr:hypothetical protein [Candidatus Parvarchaeota archaeon]